MLVLLKENKCNLLAAAWGLGFWLQTAANEAETQTEKKNKGGVQVSKICCLYPLAVVGLMVVSSLLYWSITELRWALWRRTQRTPFKFWLVFGFWPRKEDPKKSNKQSLINKRLALLAQGYLDAEKRRQALREGFGDPLGRTVLLVEYIEGAPFGYGTKILRGKEIQKYLKQIEIDQEKFRNAVDLAKTFGFEAEKSPEHYLPPTA